MKKKVLSLAIILFLVIIYFKNGDIKIYPKLKDTHLVISYKMLRVRVERYKYYKFDYYNIDDIRKIEVR